VTARFASAAAFGLFTLWASSTQADGPLDANGETITTSQYAVDLHQGAVLAGTRVVGMGGAYVAVAEDVDGNLQNPASAANRPFFSVTFFDWWPGLGATFPGTLKNLDFYNSGTQTEIKNGQDSLVFLSPALNLQWGPWGVGLTAEINNFDLDAGSANQTSLDAIFVTSHAQVSR
jgi:hypothetical protein